MAQLWQETDPEQNAVDLVPADKVPDTGWKKVLQGQDENGSIVSLIHEDTPALRRLAVHDVLINNAERKGDHVLAMGDGHRFGVDHGLTFHGEHKLADSAVGLDPGRARAPRSSKVLTGLSKDFRVSWAGT